MADHGWDFHPFKYSTRILLRHCHPSIRGGRPRCYVSRISHLVLFVLCGGSIFFHSRAWTAFSCKRKARSIISVLRIAVMTIEKLLPHDLQESTPQILQEPLVYEVLEEAPLLSNDEKLNPGWYLRSSLFFAPIADPLLL